MEPQMLTDLTRQTAVSNLSYTAGGLKSMVEWLFDLAEAGGPRDPGELTRLAEGAEETLNRVLRVAVDLMTPAEREDYVYWPECGMPDCGLRYLHEGPHEPSSDLTPGVG